MTAPGATKAITPVVALIVAIFGALLEYVIGAGLFEVVTPIVGAAFPIAAVVALNTNPVKVGVTNSLAIVRLVILTPNAGVRTCKPKKLKTKNEVTIFLS